MKTFYELRPQLAPPQPILEALDTPQEFYLTDDTKIPMNISAAFELDGTTYGMQLIMSDTDRIYEFRFHRINNTKPMRWKFTKATHIRPALSTILKFMEMAMPIIKTKCDAITVPISGKFDAKRFNGLAQRVIQKSYIKSFRYVPVLETKDTKSYKYLVIVRKPKTASQVFNTKTWKEYVWTDSGDKYAFKKDKGVPKEVLDTIEPKFKAGLKTVSKKPSTKYEFQGFAIQSSPLETPDVDDNIVNYAQKKITDIKDVGDLSGTDDVTASKGALEKKKEGPKGPSKEEKLATHDKNMPPHMDLDELAILLGAAIPTMRDLIKEKGFKEELFNKANFEYRYKDISLTGDHRHIRWIFAKNGWVKGNELSDSLTDKGEEKVKMLLKRLDKIYKGIESGEHTKTVIDTVTKQGEWNKWHKERVKIQQENPEVQSNASAVTAPSGESYIPMSGVKTKIDKSIDYSKLTTNIEGYGPYVFKQDGYSSYGEELSEDVGGKAAYISKTLGFKDLKEKGVGDIPHGKMYAYTGSASSSYNAPLREHLNKVVQTDDPVDIPSYDKKNLKSILSKNSNHMRLYKAFEEIEPFPENLWVYRGASTSMFQKKDNLNVGDDYVDPAFMSTSLKSTMTFGMNNLKLRIFIPKGSKILPILDNSQHTSEREVLLPPCSVLRIVRTDDVGFDRIITCIYKGTIFPSLRETLLNGPLKEGYVMTEATKKDEKYDPNKKFGGKYEPKFAKAITRLLKNKKLTLKK